MLFPPVFGCSIYAAGMLFSRMLSICDNKTVMINIYKGSFWILKIVLFWPSDWRKLKSIHLILISHAEWYGALFTFKKLFVFIFLGSPCSCFFCQFSQQAIGLFPTYCELSLWRKLAFIICCASIFPSYLCLDCVRDLHKYLSHYLVRCISLSWLLGFLSHLKKLLPFEVIK